MQNDIYLNKDYKRFGLKDIAVKAIFTNESNIEYISIVLSKILDLDKEYIKNNLKFMGPEIGNNVENKNAILDALYETQDLTINIEYNNYNSKNILNKNIRYVFKLYVDSFSKNKYEYKNAVQINFDCFDRFNDDELLYEVELYEKTSHKLYSDNITIYSLNLAKLNKMDYNEIIKKGKDTLEYLTYILVSKGKHEFKSIYDGDSVMEGMVDKMGSISKSTLEDLYYDKEELDKIAFKEVAYNMGHDRGVNEGIEQEKINTMKNMIDNNCDKDFIMKILNLSEEEYQSYLKRIIG